MLKEQFPFFRYTDRVYLDNAATTQKPERVLQAERRVYERINGNPHRGSHYFSSLSTDAYEEARRQVADFLGVSADELLFVSGTTAALNHLAFSLGELLVSEGDEILLSLSEHHSNLIPWQLLCQRKGAILRFIPLREDGSWDMEVAARLLSDKTRILSIGHVSNVLGVINPIEELIKMAHPFRIPVVIDGAQAVPHFPLNLSKLGCDFYAFSGHKLYAPLGIGGLYGKASWLEKLSPWFGGGGTVQKVTQQESIFLKSPHGFEAGTPNFAGAVALGEATCFLQEVGMESIQAKDRELTQHALRELEGIQGIEVFAPTQTQAGAISFVVRGVSNLDLGILLDELNVAVRVGKHCAEPLMEELGVDGTIRASFGVYNDHQDIDLFIKALKQALKILQRRQ